MRIDHPAIKALSAARYTWFSQSNVPVRFCAKRYHDMDFSHYDQEVVRVARRWRVRVSKGEVIGHGGAGLVFAGPPGHGKSMFAAILANELMFRTPQSVFQDGYQLAMRPVYYTPWSMLLGSIQRSMGVDDDSDEGIALLRLTQGVLGTCFDPAWNVKVLFLDDVGSEYSSGSGWSEGMLIQLLRTRYELGLPTVVTSNVAIHESRRFSWDRAYGAALTSFIEESSAVLPLVHSGGDQRL